MNACTAHIFGPHGSALHLDILAGDLTHARALAREHGASKFGRGFSFTVRPA